jgi:hypothetical protein
MHQETTRSHSKPVPDAEAFQRVLAAVYTLQQYHDKLAEKGAEPDGDGSRGTVAENVPAIQSGFPPPEVREPENITYDAEAEREQSYLQHPKQRQFIPIISPMPTTMSIFAQWEPPASRRYSPKFVASAITVLGVLFAALWMASIPRSLPSWLAVHRYVRRHDARAALGDSVKVASEVAARIRADRRLQLARVQVSAGKSGIITLSGEVSSGAERLLAAQHASKVKGVNVVVDNLRVIEPSYPTNVATHALPAQPGGASKARTQAVLVNTLRVPAFAKMGSASSSHRTKDANVAPSAPLSAETSSRANAAGIGSASNPSNPAVAIRASKEVTVPYGTTISVQLTEPLSSELNHSGDTFSAKLVSPIMVGSQIAIPADANVQGEIVEVRSAGHFNGSSELVAKVTRLIYNGKTYSLRSSEYATKSAARDSRTAEIIGGGAGVGAILGAILGGTKGAAIGAVFGAGVGTGARAMSKPKQIELPAQSTLSFRLETPLTVTPSPPPLSGQNRVLQTHRHLLRAG